MKKISIPREWKEIKKKHTDAIILFRIGDFYNIYEDDAEKASYILGITLSEEGGRMKSSFPKHALDAFLPKLVRAGNRVAICENLS